jgi:DNA-binding MarR family transcriptional regulator
VSKRAAKSAPGRQKQHGNGNQPAVPSPHDTSFVTEEFLPYLVTQTSNLWNRNFKQDVKRTKVSVNQWRVLSSLSRRADRSLNELVAATAIDQPTLSRIIDQLETLGFVRRQPDKDDGRILRISLTPKGGDLLRAVWPVAWKHYRLGIADLSADEERVLIKLLQRILRSLHES